MGVATRELTDAQRRGQGATPCPRRVSTLGLFEWVCLGVAGVYEILCVAIVISCDFL